MKQGTLPYKNRRQERACKRVRQVSLSFWDKRKKKSKNGRQYDYTPWTLAQPIKENLQHTYEKNTIN